MGVKYSKTRSIKMCGMAERESDFTPEQIAKVATEMRNPYKPVIHGGVARSVGEVQSSVISENGAYATMHYAPKSDPNAPAHRAAHEYETVVEDSERQIAVWKDEARRKGVEWRVFREQLLDKSDTRTIVMREGAGPEAFARVVETDRPLKKRGHSGDDKKADEIREEIRRIDDLIWANARQLRD